MLNYKKEFWYSKKILDQIQQENEDARNDIEKSISKICKEEGISFEQVCYILSFDASAFRVDNYFKPTDNSLDSLFAVICNNM